MSVVSSKSLVRAVSGGHSQVRGDGAGAGPRGVGLGWGHAGARARHDGRHGHGK